MTDFAADTLRFIATSAPSAVSNKGKWYSKLVTGVAQQFYMSDAGVEYQMAPLAPAPAGAITIAKTETKITVVSTRTLADSIAFQDMFASGSSKVTLATGWHYLRGFYGTSPTTGSAYLTRNIFFQMVASAGLVGTPGVRVHGGAQTAQTLSNGAEYSTAIRAFGTSYQVTAGPAVSRFSMHYLEGFIDVTTAGDMTPQIQFSALPGQLTNVDSQSYMEITRIGASSFVQQGGWA